MLSNTLLVIEMTLKQQFNSNWDIAEIIKFFSKYKVGMWIYPGVFRRKFSIKMEEVYLLFAALEDKGILQSYYEMYCSYCQKSMGTVELFNQLPDTFECEICHNKLPALENSVLIYKVIRND